MKPKIKPDRNDKIRAKVEAARLFAQAIFLLKRAGVSNSEYLDFIESARAGYEEAADD